MSAYLVNNSWRAKRGMKWIPVYWLGLGNRKKLFHCGFGKKCVIDVAWNPHQLPMFRLPKLRGQRIEERDIGCRIPEWLAGCIQRRDPSRRQQKSNFTVTAVEPLSNPPGLSDVFVNRGSHQRDLRIVRIKLSPAISLR